MDTVKVISLERTLSRREAFARTNPHLPHEFIDALDARTLTSDIVEDRELFEEGLRYSAGSYGCALSHLAMWNHAVDTGKPVTVAEDDAIFRHDFNEQWLRKMRELPGGWDIVVWGWNFDFLLSVDALPGVSPVVIRFDQERLRASTRTFQQLDTAVNLLRLSHCCGTPAYTISAAGAAKFRSQCFPLKNGAVYFHGLHAPLPNIGIDVAMNVVYPVTASFVAFPPLAVTKNDPSTSTVNPR